MNETLKSESNSSSSFNREHGEEGSSECDHEEIGASEGFFHSVSRLLLKN